MPSAMPAAQLRRTDTLRYAPAREQTAKPPAEAVGAALIAQEKIRSTEDFWISRKFARDV